MKRLIIACIAGLFVYYVVVMGASYFLGFTIAFSLYILTGEDFPGNLIWLIEADAILLAVLAAMLVGALIRWRKPLQTALILGGTIASILAAEAVVVGYGLIEILVYVGVVGIALLLFAVDCRIDRWLSTPHSPSIGA